MCLMLAADALLSLINSSLCRYSSGSDPPAVILLLLPRMDCGQFEFSIVLAMIARIISGKVAYCIVEDEDEQQEEDDDDNDDDERLCLSFDCSDSTDDAVAAILLPTRCTFPSLTTRHFSLPIKISPISL